MQVLGPPDLVLSVQKPSPILQFIMDRIGKDWMVLRIGKDGRGPTLVPGPGPNPKPDILAIHIGVDSAREALESGHLCKLTEDRNGSRLGWKEMGLDGSNHDFYVLLQ